MELVRFMAKIVERFVAKIVPKSVAKIRENNALVALSEKLGSRRPK